MVVPAICPENAINHKKQCAITVKEKAICLEIALSHEKKEAEVEVAEEGVLAIKADETELVSTVVKRAISQEIALKRRVRERALVNVLI